MNWKRRINQLGHAARPALILSLLCAAFYWDALWLSADHTIANNDLTDMFLPWLRFTVSSIRRGRLPLWNPHLFSGIPFAANPQPAVFYPPTWLGLLMPATRALAWVILLHLWLAGVGMYAWLRSEKASITGALFGAAVLIFSGYTFVRVWAGHLGVITTGAWLPLLLWAYRRAVKHRSWKLAIVGGLPVGLAILAGHTATFVYVALGLTLYAAFCAWERWREAGKATATVFPLACAGVMLFVGAALSSVQLLPMTELATRTTRNASTGYDFAARFSWPPGYLLTLLAPNFFGEPAHTGYWGDGIYDEFIYYVGILPLLLALLGLRLRHRLTPFLAASGLGALLLAFGKYASLHPLFYRFMPLFRLMRAPARAGFLFTLAAAALSGLTVTALQSSDREERLRLLKPLNPRLIQGVVAGALMLIMLGFMAFAWGREANPAAGRLWHQANQMTLFLLFFLLSTGLLTAWRDASLPYCGLLALSLVALDLWTFGGGIVKVKPAQPSDYWQVVDQAVDDPQAARVLPWGLNDVEQNEGLEFGLRSIFGYDPLTLQRYEEFVASRPDPRARTYDLLNAGYLATMNPQEFPDEPGAPRLLLERAGVYVYERPDALPRAWIASQIEVMDDAETLSRIHDPDFDPRTTALVDAPLTCEGVVVGEAGRVEITHYGANRIEAQVRGGGGLLIFSEVEYPGWQATVDSEPASLERADYLLRALCLPAGDHRVVLTYSSRPLKIGLAVTGLTLLLIIAASIWTARKDTV